MYCPKCGKMLASNRPHFCPGCGFRLDAVKELVVNDGVITAQESGREEQKSELSSKQRGTRQGVGLMLLGLALLPIFYGGGELIVGLSKQLAGLLLLLPITISLLGLARLCYSRFFGEGVSMSEHWHESSRSGASSGDLPPSSTQAISSMSQESHTAPTTETRQPLSVTESTTRKLSQK